MIRKIYLAAVVTIAIILNISCENKPKNDKDLIFIDNNLIDSIKDSGNSRKDQSLEVAIAAMTSPNETYSFYGQLLQYISKKINKPVHIVQRKTYDEVNQLLVEGKVDMAFICSGAYITALEQKLPIEILTIPIIDKKAYYYAYLIANSDSGINEFMDLKGKNFAYTDPISNTGFLYAKYLIKKNHFKEENFFAKTIFTYGHDYAIQAVERNIVDGACVNSLIFDYIKKKYPERIKNVKIIQKSEPFGIPPVVVRKNLDNSIKRELKMIFKNLHLDSTGSILLKKLMIDKYSEPDSTDYSSILEKSKFVNK